VENGAVHKYEAEIDRWWVADCPLLLWLLPCESAQLRIREASNQQQSTATKSMNPTRGSRHTVLPSCISVHRFVICQSSGIHVV